MSSRRSRSGGIVMTSNASRSSRSSRKLPAVTRDSRSAFVDPTIRTSTEMVSVPPTRCSSPYSMTRRIFSCILREIDASSSSTSVPPFARSKWPICVLTAPVNAPASWPNSSDSRMDSVRAAQLTLTRGCSQRLDRKCKRDAMSSLPVPRSPTTSTGFDSGAARDTCSSISRKAGASPMIACTRLSLAIR